MAMLKVPVTPEDHFQGAKDAAGTLVEYGDYECPHCGSAYSIVKRVQKHFGKELRFVFRNFPLQEIHPHAESAAERIVHGCDQEHEQTQQGCHQDVQERMQLVFVHDEEPADHDVHKRPQHDHHVHR